ncbi:MAG TPA: T9SS type A sorting domain-containing protein, partial [Cytophaga sp.]|nr:T9SS type A sorting domain-containing protein [Cytophaga sp.]
PTGATITSGANTNNITVSFATTAGTIQVIPINTCGNGDASTTSVSIISAPVAGVISGQASICPNTTSIDYSIPPLASATEYAWSLPNGASIISGANTNMITVSFATTGGSIQVTPINTCGSGTASVKSITITPIGTAPCVGPTTSDIAGPTSVSPNQQNVTYTVTNNSGSTYTWTVPAGATIISGQGTYSIVISFGTTGGIVTVQESNAYGTGTTVSKTTAIVSTGLSMDLEFNLSLYPNPTNQYSILTAKNIDPSTVHVSIIDMNGRIVSEDMWITSNELSIGEELQAGIYIIQLKIENQVLTKRWIKI